MATVICFTVAALFTVYSVVDIVEELSTNQLEDFTLTSFEYFVDQMDASFSEITNLTNEFTNDVKRAYTNTASNVTFSSLGKYFVLGENGVLAVTVIFENENNTKLMTNFENTTQYGVFVHKTFDNTTETYKKYCDTKCYTQVKQYKKNIWSEPYWLRVDDNKKLVVNCANPIMIYDNKTQKEIFLGVVIVTIDLNYFDNLLDDYRLGNFSYNLLVSKEGVFAIHPMRKYVMKKVFADTKFFSEHIFGEDNSNFTENQNAIWQVINKHAKYTEVDSIGVFKSEKSVVFCKVIEANQWFAFTVLPNSIMHNNSRELHSSLLLLLMTVGILILMFVAFFINYITSPLKYMNRIVTTFDEVDIFDWKFPIIKTGDEAENISKAFNDLINTLQTTHSKFIDASSELANAQKVQESFESNLSKIIEHHTSELIGHNKLLDMALSNVSALSDLGMLITSTLSLEKISFAVFEEIEKLIPINAFAIFIYNEKTNSLHCNYPIDNGSRTPPVKLSITEVTTISVKSFVTNKEIIVNNLEFEYQNHLLMKPQSTFDRGINSIYSNTISDGGNVLGVFTLQSKFKGIWCEFNFDIIKNLKTYLDASIRNILSYENLRQTIWELNSAQAKLLETEKMASLGQLTAGIAHEIKNPLNFVINFSELSKTLVTELRDEIKNLKENKNINSENISSSIDDVEDLISDLELNISKINEHSKRADNITKGMLQHARKGIDEAEFSLVNINNFVKEYSQLSFYGAKATDSTFNVKIFYELDESIGEVNVVSHNFSRVIINIVGNACFAAHERAKQTNKSLNFQPMVTVRTVNHRNKFSVIIKDNGTGIPAENAAKIFSPFFTTKSTGQGTGLGLSISYEIIVDGHNGEISFDTEENEFTEFKITIPKNLGQNLEQN